jgi:hypothetical protein
VPQLYAALEQLLRTQFVVTLRSQAPAAGAARQVDLEIAGAQGQGSRSRAYTSRRPEASAAASAPQGPGAVTAATPTAGGEAAAARVEAPEAGLGRTTQAALVAGAGGVIGAGALAGTGWVLGRQRRRRRRPVQLRSLWRGVSVSATPAAEVEQRPPEAVLRVRAGAAAGSTVPLRPVTSLIGTGEDCAVRLEGGRGIAEQHARLSWRGGRPLIQHLAPGYETRVNGRTVDWAPLDLGYEIAIGPALVLRYESAQQPLPPLNGRRRRAA